MPYDTETKELILTAVTANADTYAEQMYNNYRRAQNNIDHYGNVLPVWASANSEVRNSFLLAATIVIPLVIDDFEEELEENDLVIEDAPDPDP